MKAVLGGTTGNWGIATALLVLCLPQPSPAQLVDLTAEIELVSWHFQDAAGQPIEKRRTYSSHCVIGTNTWLIETDYLSNARETWWLTGNRIAKRTVITKEPSEEQKQRKNAGLVTRLPAVGERFTTLFGPGDGHPNGNMGVKVPWFAFCSGSYLKREGRQIPLPGTINDAEAFGYSDDTVTFEDHFGLPKKMALYTSDRHLTCEYQVQGTTNVLGFNFPLKFTLIQYSEDRSGHWDRHLAASGRVTSVGQRTQMNLPIEAEREPQK